MFRYIGYEDTIDCRIAVRNAFWGIPENSGYGYDMDIVGKPLSRIGPQYTHNTKAKVVKQDSYYERVDINYLQYNRVDLGTIFKGLRIKQYGLRELTPDKITNYFRNSGIYICYYADIEIVENDSIRGFWLRAKADNFVFVGEVFIQVIDTRIDVSDLVINNIITFSPEGDLWYDPEIKAVDMEGISFINDLRTATVRLGIDKKDMELYDSDIIDNYKYLNMIATGSIANQPEEYGVFLAELLSRFHSIDGWVYVKDTSNGITGEINIAECEVLYNGKTSATDASEYVNKYMKTRYTDVLVFKPLSTHKFYSNAFTRYATLYYNG